MKKIKIINALFYASLCCVGWFASSATVIDSEKGRPTTVSPNEPIGASGIGCVGSINTKHLSFHQLTELMKSGDIFVQGEEGSRKWNEEWRTNTLRLLPKLNVPHYFTFADNLAEIYGKRFLPNYLTSFPDLPADILPAFIRAGENLLPQLTKDELMNIIGYINYFRVTPPEGFIQAWRHSSDEKRREFSGEERDLIRLIFKKWGIPPRDLNSILQNGNNSNNNSETDNQL